jgi:hypothetical protein
MQRDVVVADLLLGKQRPLSTVHRPETDERNVVFAFLKALIALSKIS